LRRGQSVLPVIAALGKWGDDHQEHLGRVIGKIPRSQFFNDNS